MSVKGYKKWFEDLSLKYVDVPGVVLPFNPTPTFGNSSTVCLNTIKLGTDVNQLLGNEMSIEGIECEYDIVNNQQPINTGYNADPDIHRVLIFYDEYGSPNGGLPFNANEVLNSLDYTGGQTSILTSSYSNLNRGRFKYFYDRSFQVPGLYNGLTTNYGLRWQMNPVSSTSQLNIGSGTYTFAGAGGNIVMPALTGGSVSNTNEISYLFQYDPNNRPNGGIAGVLGQFNEYKLHQKFRIPLHCLKARYNNNNTGTFTDIISGGLYIQLWCLNTVDYSGTGFGYYSFYSCNFRCRIYYRDKTKYDLDPKYVPKIVEFPKIFIKSEVQEVKDDVKYEYPDVDKEYVFTDNNIGKFSGSSNVRSVSKKRQYVVLDDDEDSGSSEESEELSDYEDNLPIKKRKF